MPRLDGYGAMRAMRELRSDVPVLLMSGYNRQVDQDQLPNAFVQKPFAPTELLTSIDDLLHQPARET